MHKTSGFERSALMRLRFLRLVVDEGHELGHNDAAGWSDAANRFIAGIAAERRWVMSGTPVGARSEGAPICARAPIRMHNRGGGGVPVTRRRRRRPCPARRRRVCRRVLA